MHGYATNIIMVTAVFLGVTVLNERLFASSDSAGCMGCHQAETITTIDDQIDKTNVNPRVHQTVNNQKKLLTDSGMT